MYSGVSLAQVCALPGSGGTTPVGNAYYPGTGTGGAGTATPNSLTVGSARAVEPGFFMSNTAFQPGDLAFIWQVQDAVFNIENNNRYGDGIGDGTSPNTQTATNYNGSGWTDLRQAGKYEFAQVTNSVPTTGGTLTFSAPLVNTYTTADATPTTPRRRYQVIRVAQNSNLALPATVNVLPWNGFTGGIVVFDVAGTLSAPGGGATINGNGAGFRGGGGAVGFSGAGNPSSSDYITDPNNNTVAQGARKGEGIGGTPDLVRGAVGAPVTITANGRTLITPGAGASGATNGVPAGLTGGDLGYPGNANGGTRSRGAPGNAGGGGSAHNSGGGGGSNVGTGGQGAHSFGFYRNVNNSPSCVNESATVSPAGTPWFSCNGDGTRFVGGRPGRSLAIAEFQNPNNRLTMGGGGGAGDGNNQSDNPTVAQGSGGNGGAAVFIRAQNLSLVNPITINVNGQDGLPGGRDGAGGGGAGGAVVVFTGTTSLAGLTINARGGNGGDTGVPLRNGETQGGGGAGGGGAVLLPSGATGATLFVAGGVAGRNYQDPDNNAGTPPISNSMGAGAGAGATGTIVFNNTQVPPPSDCAPALTVTKNSLPSSTGGNTFPAGTTTVQYSVTISNAAGRPTATGVNVVDALPAPFTFAGGSATVVYAGGATKGDGSTGTTIAGTGTSTVTFGATGAPSANNFTIPGGGSVTLTFTVNTNGAAAGTYQNPATANFTDPITGLPSTTPAQYVAASSNNDDVTILAAPTLTKTIAPTHIAPGQTSVLTINLGNPNSTAITLTQALVDNLPSGVVVASPANLSDTCPGTATNTATSVTYPSGSQIPAGGCIITVNVTSSAVGLYTNTIPAGTNPNGLNTNAGAAPSASAPLVVLEPTKRVKLLTDADTSGAPSVGDTVQYQIIYTLPAGAPTVANFQIFDVLPSQVTYVGSSLVVTPSGGTPAQTGTANAGYTGLATTSTSATLLSTPVTLQAGGTITATINATINNTAVNGTPFNNTARASGTGLPAVTGNGTGGGLLSDADATPFGTPASALPQPNDTAATGEPTQVTPQAPQADLVVTKSQPSAAVNSGGTITYTVTVRNNGPATASNVVVTDTLPAGTTFQSASNGGTQTAGVVTWNSTTTPALASLANGASQTFTVVVTAP
ncbi:MAG: isopeptide-forming domain-containing fimbrial protein [Deinococcales bacterium]